MAIGPVIGDWLFRDAIIDRGMVNMMFLVAAAMATLALFTAGLAVSLARDHHAFRSHRTRMTPKPGQGPLRMVWNRRPGMILVMGMLMGLSISFPGTFLRPMAEENNIDNIRTFFVVYNIAAFISRLLFRHAPQVLGLKPTILIGFGFMALSMLLYLPVKSAADFWMPALAGGLAHSFLFPSVIASCTHRFPIQQRGLATHLILAMHAAGRIDRHPRSRGRLATLPGGHRNVVRVDRRNVAGLSGHRPRAVEIAAPTHRGHECLHVRVSYFEPRRAPRKPRRRSAARQVNMMTENPK